jgi:hypothetical protein
MAIRITVILFCGNPLSKYCGLPRTAGYIWAWNLGSEWNPDYAILDWEAPVVEFLIEVRTRECALYR